MYFLGIIAPFVLVCGAAWAQPAPVRPAGAEAAPSRPPEGGKRRSELKAVLQAEENGALPTSVGLDATKRQQLRQQLRDQSGR